MNVSICALKGDLQRNKPLKSVSVLQSDKNYKKRTRRAFHLGFSGGNDQSVFIIAGYLIIVINYLLPAGHWRWSSGCRVTSSLNW